MVDELVEMGRRGDRERQQLDAPEQCQEPSTHSRTVGRGLGSSEDRRLTTTVTTSITTKPAAKTANARMEAG